MKKRLPARRSKGLGKSINWLPVDSRLFVPFLSFGHVTGVARLFLEIEILLSIGIVLGTLILSGFVLFR